MLKQGYVALAMPFSMGTALGMSKIEYYF